MAFTYDANGNLLTLTDPVDNTTTWVYDTLNRVIQETNELNQHRYLVYDALGNLKRRTDRLGREITFEHDHLNRQTAEEWWDGAAPSIAVTTSTDGSTTNEVQVVGFATAYLLETGTFTLTYGGQTTDPIPFDADAATVQAELEALSNLSPGEVLVVKLTDDPDEQEWQITFTGPLAGTNVSQITIDASSVYDGTGAPTDSEGTTTQGAKVNEVQVITLSDTTGGTFTLSYGGQSTAPIAWNASTSTVDSALEALSGAGTVTVSGSAGGPYTITFTGAYGGVNLAPLIYADNLLTNGDLVRTIAYMFNDDGDLVEVSDPSATYEFVYDGLGRVTNYVQNIAGLTGEIEFESTYNAAGRRTTLQAILDGTDDFKNTYSYDDLLRLSRLIQEDVSGGNAVAEKRIDLGYNAASQYTRLDRYADAAGTEFVASSHYSYDNLNRLQKLVHAETTTNPTSGWGSDPLAGYQYTYDAASRILSIDSLIDGLSEYAHDATNQLVGADHNTASDESYEYDANGNRIMAGYSITANNQLQSDGTYNYTYDSEGNRLTRTKISNGYVTRYSWDHRNRLTKVTEEDNASNILQVTEQSYDAFNQWIRRNFDSDGPGGTAAVDTFFAYENGQIVLHFDGDDAADLSHRYLWGENVDQLFADESVSNLGSAGAIIWSLGDHLGTLGDIVEYDSGLDDATIANHREYDSFGKSTNETNAGIDLMFGFTGRPFDEAIDLQNNLNRWYDDNAGIWLSEDPITFGGGDSHLARYVSNMPLGALDPLGLKITIGYWESPISGYPISLIVKPYTNNDTKSLGMTRILRWNYDVTAYGANGEVLGHESKDETHLSIVGASNETLNLMPNAEKLAFLEHTNTTASRKLCRIEGRILSSITYATSATIVDKAGNTATFRPGPANKGPYSGSYSLDVFDDARDTNHVYGWGRGGAYSALTPVGTYAYGEINAAFTLDYSNMTAAYTVWTSSSGAMDLSGLDYSWTGAFMHGVHRIGEPHPSMIEPHGEPSFWRELWRDRWRDKWLDGYRYRNR